MQTYVGLWYEFAGGLKDIESTSGLLLSLGGSHTSCPTTWLCQKQGAIPRSSAEAEIIVLDMGLTLDGLPAMCLLDLVVNVSGGPAYILNCEHFWWGFYMCAEI